MNLTPDELKAVQIVVGLLLTSGVFWGIWKWVLEKGWTLALLAYDALKQVPELVRQISELQSQMLGLRNQIGKLQLAVGKAAGMDDLDDLNKTQSNLQQKIADDKIKVFEMVRDLADDNHKALQDIRNEYVRREDLEAKVLQVAMRYCKENCKGDA